MVQKSCTRVTIGIPKHHEWDLDEMFTIDQLVHEVFFHPQYLPKMGRFHGKMLGMTWDLSFFRWLVVWILEHFFIFSIYWE